MPAPILGALTSLTGGGALAAPTNSAAGPSSTGDVNVGGLNAPALPSQQRALILAGTILAGIFLWRRK